MDPPPKPTPPLEATLVVLPVLPLPLVTPEPVLVVALPVVVPVVVPVVAPSVLALLPVLVSTPPLPLERVTPTLPDRVGNRLARASSTSACELT